MKKAKVKVSKGAYKVSKGELSTYRIYFSPKQTEKFRKKIGLTVEGIDVMFNDGKDKVKVVRMYRNGKRIHRKPRFKAKLSKKGL